MNPDIKRRSPALSIKPKGIANVSGYSCHISSGLQLIYHCLPSVRNALICLSELADPPALSELGRLFADLERDDDATCVDPSNLYNVFEKENLLQSNDLGDAVSALRILLRTIKSQVSEKINSSPCFASLIEMLEMELDGSMEQTVTGRKGKFKRWKVKQLALPSPFPVPRAESVNLGIFHATLQPQEIRGYSWDHADGYKEIEVDEDLDLEAWVTSKTSVFQSLPETLLLHLQRFTFVDGQTQLLTQEMDIPLRLDMNNYSQNNLASREYELVGCLLHASATAEGDEGEVGHYVSLVRWEERWLLLDDDDATEMSYSEQEMLEFLSCRPSNVELKAGSISCPTLLVYVKEGVKSNGSLLTTFAEQLKEESKKQSEWDNSIIGRRVKVLWTKGMFYPGTVVAYNATKGKHKVEYDDGDVREYNLKKKTIEWI